jgi:hypothetical protein
MEIPNECNELLAWLDSGDLLREPVLPADEAWIVIHDQNEAIARSRGYDSDAELTWLDLRELVSSEIPLAAERSGAYPEPYQRFSTELLSRFDRLGSRLPERMKPFEHDIVGDFFETCRAMIFKAHRPMRFYSMLLNAYRKGYFPCDWAGKYPRGRLVVFS